MDSPFTAFSAFAELLAAFITLMLLSLVVRGVRSASSWVRTSGRIKSFGLSNGMPSVVYDYEAGGTLRTGKAIVPGPLSGKYAGQTSPPKATYLHSDGSLKFPPNAIVDVYVNPNDPADAALVPGIQMGIWKGFVLALACASAPFIYSAYQSWFAQNWGILFSAVFFSAGIFLIYYGIRLLQRCLETRNCPSVPGRLLKAEVVYSSSSENGGYAPSVEFEYTVEGQLYESRQWTAIPVQVLTSRQKAQAKVDAMRSEPQLTVYYNPHTPWEGILRPGPYWGAALPMLMGLAFAGVGLLSYFIKH